MKIDRSKAAIGPRVSGDGGTVWMGAADTSGLVASYLQSIYWEFAPAACCPLQAS